MKRQLKRLVGSLADLTSKVALDPLYPSERVDPDLAGELRKAFSGMPPEQLHSDSRVENEWNDLRRRLRVQFSSPPDAFLRHEPACFLLAIANSKTALAAYKYLRRSPDWKRYSAVLNEDSTGRPRRFWPRPSTSGIQVLHTFHAANFEHETGTRIDSMRLIVEFGGGYGGFCRQAHGLGFRGKYVIFDLPELSALQKYYLRSVGLTILPREAWTEPGSTGIILLTSITDLDQVFSAVRESLRPSLLVATWSLSEVPRGLREEILATVGDCDHFLIAYQTKFGSVPNPEFFSEMMQKRGGAAAWKHLPHYGNPLNFYVLR